MFGEREHNIRITRFQVKQLAYNEAEAETWYKP